MVKTNGCIGIDLTSNDDYAILKLSDNGSGIKEKHQKNIFNFSFSTKTSGNERGMGLSIVKSLILKSNGFMDMSSKENIGTIFTIYFPLA